MKKFLFLAIAALGFAACTEKGLENSDPNGELEQSYVAITLAADDMSTKATDGKYEAGLPVEREVKSAYVFFFKDGAAFPVTFNESDKTTTNTGASNYLKVNLAGNTSGMPNVSDVKDAVLILQKYKGEYPNQIVAVLNWTPETNKNYTLENLQSKIADLGNDVNGYVMSNAVYADNKGDKVDAVALTVANIAKNEDDALKNPVTIHVERVAAKVVFTAKSEGKFYVEKSVDGKAVYAQIKGFELYNDYQQSWLIKKINPSSWTDLGFNWNDAYWFRSYWAQSLGTDFEENTFAWKTDNKNINEFVYCGENTRSWTEDADVRTKVIVKAQLVDGDGEPIEVVNWYGKDYIGEDALKTVVANTLNKTYFYGDGQTFDGLTPQDIKCVARDANATNAFEVYFQLSGNGATKNWYKYDNGNYTKIADKDDYAAFNATLAAIQPALVYNDGMTYYWTDIKHLGAEGSTAEFGIVRNHVYKVNITDITGYGTPVYDPTMDFITPEKPVDINSFVSAQINILSWRMVEEDYQLGN